MADLLGGPDWRVFAVTDMEFYVARSRDEAIRAACSDWGCASAEQADADGMLDLEDVYEISDDGLDRLQFQDTDEDERPIGPPRSFREELARRVAAGLKAAEPFGYQE